MRRWISGSMAMMLSSEAASSMSTRAAKPAGSMVVLLVVGVLAVYCAGSSLLALPFR